ncbi:uncharacterized protein LOC132049976 [Lycium ferocissimum]|uniref:uncharacterized protein LOC132049976 n=1 Tax=Lycium ferocissimum TaxID=112874 RepID=UPI0028159243|nr:uncharacterized protein LOC132049976 [Lycium ferocissimum]XP_059296960.1 uncharacterized protein LOC132049976 [Lycium ferocissimum]
MGLQKNYEDFKRQLLGSEHQNSSEEKNNTKHEDLIKEVALLELEIMYLEKYLLSMYRKTFAKRLESLSIKDESTKTNSAPKERKFSEVKKHNSKTKENPITNTSPSLPPLTNPPEECNETPGDPSLVDNTVVRCHSSLSHTAASFKPSPLVGVLADAVDSYHSLPLSMLEHAQVSTSNWKAGEHFVNGSSNHFHDPPNQLSEEMIKCISAIYIQLADPPLFSYDYPFSPISLSSSALESFPHGQNDIGALQSEESSSNSRLNNPFHLKEPREFSGSFVTTTEVQGLCRDKRSLDGVERMLQHFRYLVSKLKEVDPRKMRHDEKLAFWINVHNALVMHAFLVYGIPRSNLKRVSQLLKAAYNIGGNTVSVEMIQSSILGCRLPRPGQWIQSLFFPKQKFKAGDARKGYAIEHPDPRLRFALCSGCHSDALLRLYTPQRVFEELEVAKEEYLQTNTRVHKEQKLVLPKNVESYVKEVDLCPSGFMEMIELALPAHFIKKYQGRIWKKIEWIPHNFTFRYLISHELVESVISF